jgi:hypothetical protein
VAFEAGAAASGAAAPGCVEAGCSGGLLVQAVTSNSAAKLSATLPMRINTSNGTTL